VSLSLDTAQENMPPKVSVVIPTYNRSALLCRAIDSVLRQTYTDYELIVIDDGSTDDTRERLEPYMGRIRYFYQPNAGASAAQNAGVKVARGEWVSILGSDDVWLPTKLERQFEAVRALGDDYGVCVTNCNYMGLSAMTTTVFEEAGLRPDAEFGPLQNPVQYIVGENGLCVQSLVMLRSLFHEVGGFDEALSLSEDRDLVCRLSFRTKFCYVATPLVSIDRTPEVRRLTNLLARRSDEAYGWLELAQKKMLAQPETVDPQIRQTVKEALAALYYGWTAERLSGLKLRVAFENIRKIRGLGQSYSTITWTLLIRAGGKISRTLRNCIGRNRVPLVSRTL
jgi:glycosyltransferase involved in cell wall biosynthesis